MRRVIVPMSLKKLEQVLTGRIGKPIQICGLPKDAELITVFVKSRKGIILCVFEHESFAEIQDHDAMPVMQIKSKFKPMKKQTAFDSCVCKDCR